MEKVYIAFGSNLGDRFEYLKEVISFFEDSEDFAQLRTASLYITKPQGMSDTSAEDFLNTVFELETSLSAEELLRVLLERESDLGRIRKTENDSRTVDLDILFYGNEVLDQESLKVPHPRLHERAFVLKPLAELCPEKIHPILNKRNIELLENLNIKDNEIYKVEANKH